MLGVVAHGTLVMIVAAPLFYAAVTKFLTPDLFVGSLAQLRLQLPNRPSTARAVGTIEFTLASAILLSTGWASALAVSCMYVVFAAVLMRARRLGAGGDCGCFGALPTEINTQAILRNLVLAGAAGAIALARWNNALPNYSSGTALVVGVSLCVGALALDTYVTVSQFRRRS
jgi:hypothetical protein